MIYDDGDEYDDEYDELGGYEEDEETCYRPPMRAKEEDAVFEEPFPTLYPEDPEDPWRGVPDAILQRAEEICFPLKRGHPNFNSMARIMGLIQWPPSGGDGEGGWRR